MSLRRLSRYTLLVLCLVAISLVALEPGRRLQAQHGAITLTVAVPDMLRDVFDPKLIGDFEASHPGIKINVVGTNQEVPFAANGLDQHFEGLQKLANAGDVLYVDLNTLNSSAATRAGYFLNLASFANDDRTLNSDDFYPSIWRTFQWDQGLWALPVAAEPTVLIYDPAAFDKAGLAYPDSKWTLDDLVKAVRALSVKDASGKVTMPGMAVFSQAEVYLFLSMLGESLADTGSIPNAPQIDKPALETMLDTWMKLQQEGLIGGDLNNAPLTIAPVFLLTATNMSDKHYAGTLLPGGRAGVNVTGFAVSNGTQYPAQAYELAKFLTMRPEMSRRMPSTPARKSLASAPGRAPDPRLTMSPEVQQLNDAAIANALTLTDLRFGDYLLLALRNMESTHVDARTALQTAEAEAIKAVQAADQKKDTLTFAVATPIPQVAPAKGKITLTFGLTSFLMPLPGRDAWDRVLNDFAANDPQVGKVNLEIAQNQVDTSATRYDCFYLPYNAVPGANLANLLNLDPFLSADSTFDKNDFIGNVLAQLQRDNKTWALPIVIQPALLAYNTDRFSKANVPAPVNGWTISAFDDALKALKTDRNGEPPFVPRGIDGIGTYVLNLIAAHGGVPIDYRSNPVGVNFTDPATLDAIRQVLDLAKQGYIKYSKLGNKPFQPISIIMLGGRTEDAIHSTELNAPAFRSPDASTQATPYQLTTYPKGSKYSALGYSIGAAYISAQSQNPDACYRLISAIARHPELFESMPARRSLINADAAAAVQGADLTALYNQIDALLKDPNTVPLPSGFAGRDPGRMVVEYWLYDAFDNYVLRDGDLESSLKDAETYAKGFQACMAQAATPEPGQTDQPDTARTCAQTVDPHLKG